MRDKQLDEMAKVMCFQADSCTVKSCVQVNCEKTWLAENLYNAGYRKASEVAEDIIRILRAAGINEHRYPVVAEIKKKYTEGEG